MGLLDIRQGWIATAARPAGLGPGMEVGPAGPPADPADPADPGGICARVPPMSVRYACCWVWPVCRFRAVAGSGVPLGRFRVLGLCPEVAPAGVASCWPWFGWGPGDLSAHSSVGAVPPVPADRLYSLGFMYVIRGWAGGRLDDGRLQPGAHRAALVMAWRVEPASLAAVLRAEA